METDHQLIASGDKLLELIPQRPPIVMVDALTGFEEERFQTRFLVKDGEILVENGKLTEPGLIENIAQTAAAGVGYKYTRKNKPIPIGFIGAVQKLRIFDLPLVGQTIDTVVEILHVVMDIRVVSGKITCNNRSIAQCELKLFLNDEG